VDCGYGCVLPWLVCLSLLSGLSRSDAWDLPCTCHGFGLSVSLMLLMMNASTCLFCLGTWRFLMRIAASAHGLTASHAAMCLCTYQAPSIPGLPEHKTFIPSTAPEDIKPVPKAHCSYSPRSVLSAPAAPVSSPSTCRFFSGPSCSAFRSKASGGRPNDARISSSLLSRLLRFASSAAAVCSPLESSAEASVDGRYLTSRSPRLEMQQAELRLGVLRGMGCVVSRRRRWKLPKARGPTRFSCSHY
jgi:hypothetical protein